MRLGKSHFIDIINISILIILILIAIQLFFVNFDTPWTHFSDQTQSFLTGKVNVTPLDFDRHDYVILHGKYYWHQGPFPSILLVPFQILSGPSFKQGSMQLILIIILSLTIFRLAKLKNFNNLDSFYLTIVFLLGSPVAGLIVDPKSWFFSQIVAVTVLSLLMLELESFKKWWLIGILAGVLITTRFTSGFIIFALVFLLYKEKSMRHEKLVNYISLLLPIFISGLGLAWFNNIRFGDALNNGYLTNDVGGYLSPLRELGFFNLQHIPTNFYYYFFASVEPITSNISVHLRFPFIKYSYWGMSFLLVAPFFLYSLKSLRRSSTYLQSLWVIVAVTLFTLLIYFAPGWVQFGPRYTVDFMPILFLITLYSLAPPKLTALQKVLITVSCLFNIYLLSTPYFFR